MQAGLQAGLRAGLQITDRRILGLSRRRLTRALRRIRWLLRILRPCGPRQSQDKHSTGDKRRNLPHCGLQQQHRQPTNSIELRKWKRRGKWYERASCAQCESEPNHCGKTTYEDLNVCRAASRPSGHPEQVSGPSCRNPRQTQLARALGRTPLQDFHSFPLAELLLLFPRSRTNSTLRLDFAAVV